MGKNRNNTSDKDQQFASDAARKAAEENNLDPAEIDGTGAGGKVTKDDVVAQKSAQDEDLGPNGLPTDIRADADPSEVAAQIKAVLGGPDVPVKINPVLGSSRVNFPDFLGEGSREFVRRTGEEADEYLSSQEWDAIRRDPTNRDREGRQILIRGGAS